MGPGMKLGMMMAMAGIMGAGFGVGMGDCEEKKSRYQPVIEPGKPVLPGKFNGILPKGCKIETVKIETKWQGYFLTQNVDIVFGSLKAKQKAIVKAEYEIKNYLSRRSNRENKGFSEFDQVELGHL